MRLRRQPLVPLLRLRGRRYRLELGFDRNFLRGTHRVWPQILRRNLHPRFSRPRQEGLFALMTKTYHRSRVTGNMGTSPPHFRLAFTRH